MDKYVKLKELEKLTNCKIKDIKELSQGHVYIIGLDIGQIPMETASVIIDLFREQITSMGVKALVYPRREGVSELVIHELDSAVKEVNVEDTL